MIKKLDYGEVKPIHMTLTLADRSIVYPCVIIEDMLIKVDDFLFPTGFFILDMKDNEKNTFDLWKSILGTSTTLIDVDLDELLLRIQEKKVNFIVFEAMHNHNGNSQCYCVDIVKYAVEKAQKPNILEMEEFPA